MTEKKPGKPLPPSPLRKPFTPEELLRDHSVDTSPMNKTKREKPLSPKIRIVGVILEGDDTSATDASQEE